MGPYRPPSSQDELEQILRRGSTKISRDERPLRLAGVAVTVVWVAVLVFIAWALINLGIIDPDFCRGTMNPASC